MTDSLPNLLPSAAYVRLAEMMRMARTGSFTLHLSEGSVASFEERSTHRIDKGRKRADDTRV